MKTLILYSDAKASHNRFAICDKNGDPLWYGKFFDNDRDYNGEQSSGELAAAKKAVWLASKIQEAIGERVALTLRVDAEWLKWANATKDPKSKKKTGGKARELSAIAKRLNVDLTVEWIPGVDNPADQYTVCHGFRKYSETPLSALI